MRFILLTTVFFFSSLHIKAFERQRPGELVDKNDSSNSETSKENLKPLGKEGATVKDRWRYFYEGNWYDPYNTNILKGDLPIFGSQENPWFLEILLRSDSLFEYRDVPIPVGVSSTHSAQTLNLLGREGGEFFGQTFTGLFSLYQGNTSFKPPQWEFRISPVFNLNMLRVREDSFVNVNPEKSNQRTDFYLGIQELFVDYHIADLTERYDFVSVRAGVQLFNADFRGFLFNASEPGIRFFGTWDDNFWQFNLAYFRRVDKDTNSGLNIIWEDRHENIFLANLYRQDFPVLGHSSQIILLQRLDFAGDQGLDYDDNGFLVRPSSIGDERPKNVYTTYLGLNGDGHFGRLNTTSSFYLAFGKETHNPIAGRGVDIFAWMLAAELSYDWDWVRFKLSGIWASGDSDPYDSKASGFDAVFDQPNFIGGDHSYWLRQGIPYIAGGILPLVNRLSFLPNLRAGKEEGQSNFVNPGLRLLHAGADIELTPKIKILNNFSFLSFDETAVLEATRQDGSINRLIGYDFSTALLYRPLLNNHIQFRLGAALFFPSSGFENLFGGGIRTQIFSNLILEY